MIDKSQADILALVSRYTRVTRKATTHGGEYTGACPICKAGTDRFQVWPYRSDQDAPIFYCRHCDNSGDIIKLISLAEGLEPRGAGFVKICEIAGIPLDSAETTPRKTPKLRLHLDGKPNATWQFQAELLVKAAEAYLWSSHGTVARDYLLERGLQQETIKAARLGYIPRDDFDDKEAWGIPDEDRAKKVFMPRGILIPWFINDELYKLNVRRGERSMEEDAEKGMKPRKYIDLKGGSRGLYRVDLVEKHTPLFIVEGEFDALLLSQQVGRLSSVVATGSTDRGRADDWTMHLSRASHTILAFDNDSGGKGALKYWKQVFPDALVWTPVGEGADITDMYLAGKDIRRWAVKAMTLSGYDVPPFCVACGKLDDDLQSTAFFYDEHGKLFCSSECEQYVNKKASMEA